MQEIFAIALGSMHQDMASLDRVALNLSNVATSGYKREVGIPKTFAHAFEMADFRLAAEVAENLVEPNGVVKGRAVVSPTVMTSISDMRVGTQKMTGQPLDVALGSEGFFEVITENGPAYTRQGDFRLDATGRLVTSQGLPVMGQNGVIHLTTQTPIIDTAGRITEPNAATGAYANAGTSLAQLKVVKFDDPKHLQRLGNGLMSAEAGVKVLSDGEVSIRQGALENSNVNSMHEMVSLISTMRHFESMQKVAVGYDDMLALAIRKLGDLS